MDASIASLVEVGVSEDVAREALSQDSFTIAAKLIRNESKYSMTLSDVKRLMGLALLNRKDVCWEDIGLALKRRNSHESC
jgi:hypothetical protein